MPVTYEIKQSVEVNQFIDLLRRSSLSERRPIDDLECMQGMIDNADLMVTAWHGQKLVGVARSVTDFHFCCYLSDLAVDKAYQKQGIGIQLQRLTRQQLNDHCKIILLAAPEAAGYYGHIGYTKHDRCWVLDRSDQLAAQRV